MNTPPLDATMRFPEAWLWPPASAVALWLILRLGVGGWMAAAPLSLALAALAAWRAMAIPAAAPRSLPAWAPGAGWATLFLLLAIALEPWGGEGPGSLGKTTELQVGLVAGVLPALSVMAARLPARRLRPAAAALAAATALLFFAVRFATSLDLSFHSDATPLRFVAWLFPAAVAGARSAFREEPAPAHLPATVAVAAAWLWLALLAVGFSSSYNWIARGDVPLGGWLAMARTTGTWALVGFLAYLLAGPVRRRLGAAWPRVALCGLLAALLPWVFLTPWFFEDPT